MWRNVDSVHIKDELLCVYIRLRAGPNVGNQGHCLMHCLLSEWGVSSFITMPLTEVNMLPKTRSCLSGRQVDFHHTTPAAPGGMGIKGNTGGAVKKS